MKNSISTFSIDGEGYCPVITCAHCRERITDAASANVLWSTPDMPVDGVEPLTPIAVHKACSYAYENGNHLLFDEMTAWIKNLAHNVGMKLPAA